ncbi:MAG: hypothetical protein WCT23_04445 [Candidatus Neomarinimicrobiota bacterium]|jgi:hypothetical protein
MDTIKLNDILRLDYLNKLMIRFNLTCGENWNPIEMCLYTLDRNLSEFKGKERDCGDL